MPTITVPSGTGGASVSLTFASAATASLATSLLSAVYAGTVASSAVDFIGTAGTYTVPAGDSVVVDYATGVSTIVGNGSAGESIVAGDGATFSFTAGTGTGTIVSGVGSDTFVGTNGGFSLLGSGTVTSFVGGVTTVSGGTTALTGSSTVTAGGSGAFIFGSGSGTTDNITNTGTGSSVVLNAAASTVNAAAGSSGLYYSTAGTLSFTNNGSATLVGSTGSGAATIFAGANASTTFFQGTSSGFTELVNGGGGTAAVVSGTAGGILGFNSAGGTVNLYGTPTGSSFNYLVGGSGSETLNAAFSGGTAVLIAGAANATAYLSNSGADAFFAGSGSSTIVGGTTGSGTALPDLYAFANGSSGGSDTILNWGASSGLVFIGYGNAGDASIKSAIAAAGSGSAVSITLPDNTKITLIGINGATVNPSNNPTFLS